MTATRGPVPKRSTERRRRNKPAAGDAIATVHVALPGVEAPETPAGLHPVAAEWFNSLKASGQATFYEPSDWAAAMYVARELSRVLRNKFSAQGFAAVWAAMGELLTTEGARRRVRLEVERQPPGSKPAPVSVLDDYRGSAAG